MAVKQAESCLNALRSCGSCQVELLYHHFTHLVLHLRDDESLCFVSVSCILQKRHCVSDLCWIAATAGIVLMPQVELFTGICSHQDCEGIGTNGM